MRPCALEWLCLAVGSALVLRYAWLMDDAYIYFRYVDNAVFLGHGLVYNAGEHVEGFSSPLWTLLLLALRATGLDYWILVRIVALAGFFAFFTLVVGVNRRLAPPTAPVIDVPLIHLTFAYPVACYFTSGMETPLVLVAAAGFAAFAVAPRSRLSALLLPLAPLVRHELLLPFGLAVFLAWRREGRPPRTLLAVFVASFGAWMLFRVGYYADLFPATYYLKSGTDIAQGLVYLWETVSTYGLVALLILGWGASHLATGTLETRRARVWMLLFGGSVALYVVKIGGDAIHFRYLAFPYVLFSCSLAGLAEGMAVRLPKRFSAPAGVALGLVVAVATALQYPSQLDAHPISRTENHRTRHKINDASLHRSNPGLTPAPWRLKLARDPIPAYAEHRSTGGPAYRTVRGGRWCVEFYEAFDARVVHGYGLTDPILARTVMQADRPGHKDGLIALSKDLIRIHARAGSVAAPDMYRRAVEHGIAPAWIRDNLEVIEQISRKTYNAGDLLENLSLALSPVARVDPGDRRR